MTPATLRAQAIRLLARREYARSELEERLLARGGPLQEVRALLEELERQGYLSNERYARAVVTRKSGGHSRRRIAAGLRAKGVSGDDIAAALAEASPDDAIALDALWQRKFGKAPIDEKEKARQVRFLQSRGFALSAILKLLRGLDR